MADLATDDDPNNSDFPTRNAVYAEATIVEANGRWVVYLEVGFWEPNEAENLQTVRRRIQDYPKKRLAEIAAKWIERAAKKDLQAPSIGL